MGYTPGCSRAVRGWPANHLALVLRSRPLACSRPSVWAASLQCCSLHRGGKGLNENAWRGGKSLSPPASGGAEKNTRESRNWVSPPTLGFAGGSGPCFERAAAKWGHACFSLPRKRTRSGWAGFREHPWDALTVTQTYSKPGAVPLLSQARSKGGGTAPQSWWVEPRACADPSARLPPGAAR